MTEELKQKAENFIIDRYKLNECYREDNEETRGYMRMDVHYQYKEEYQLYIAVATEVTKELETQLTEKDKQIEELERKLEQAENDLADYQFNYPTIKELEKENAELRKELEMSNEVYNDNLDYSHHIEGQLTKAKEIIKKLKALYLSPVVTKDDVKRQDEILAEAEQFINS